MLTTQRALVRLCISREVPWRVHNVCRSYANLSQRNGARKRKEVRFDFNAKAEDSIIKASADHVKLKQVTANDLESYKEPPRNVKMLVRDYIEDALYNPNYGYFPKQATIFTGLENTTLNFSEMRDSNEFQEIVAKKYEDFRDGAVGPGLQVFHTPTELFRVSLIKSEAVRLSLWIHPIQATLWTGDCSMHNIGISSEILPLRGSQFIRDRSWKRVPSKRHPRFYPATSPRSLRTYKVYYYRDQ